MYKNVNILKRLIAITLVVALAFPTLTQLVHTIDTHEHNYCENKTTHLHEVDHQNCDVCDFNFSTFTFNINAFGNETLNINTPFLKKEFVSINTSKKYTNHKQLRAPPAILFS